MTTTATTRWHLEGEGYEYCNCDFGCGCNFGGFPNSKDGSCRAFVGLRVARGHCGDIDLAGVKVAEIVSWPKAIHEGNGEAVIVVDTAASDAQAQAMRRIIDGSLGGLPFELLGQTYTVVELVRAPITIEGAGRKTVFRVEGVGEGRGDTFKNPVTNEDHLVDVVLPTGGIIWDRGECGQGSFRASAAGVSVAGEKSNWIYYQVNWSNAKAA